VGSRRSLISHTGTVVPPYGAGRDRRVHRAFKVNTTDRYSDGE